MKLLIVLLGSLGTLSAQTLTNDDATIHVGNSATLYVEGAVLNQKQGNFKNTGVVKVTGDFTNNATNTAFVNGLAGDVHLLGNTQEINGSSPTHFYNLYLEGGSSLKELQQDIRILNHLELNDAELQVHDSKAHLSNPSSAALTWSNGFISGDSIGGYFTRSTNSTNVYVFPVGGSNLYGVYRAIELQPTTSDSTLFGVRLAGVDASSDATGTSITGAQGSYNRSAVDYKIDYVNETFYHHMARIEGKSGATYKLYYFNQDAPTDGKDFQLVGYWNKTKSQWEGDPATYADATGKVTIGSPTKVASGVLNTSKDDPIALATKAFFIPEGFSPNGDGENDAFVIQGVKGTIGLSVYNRYGNLVFESSDYKNEFKGVANKGLVLGEQLPDGTYFYILKTATNEQQGYFTINR